MTATIQTILLLLAVMVVVAVVARRLNIAPSILMVAAGILLALVPGLPRIAVFVSLRRWCHRIRPPPFPFP